MSLNDDVEVLIKAIRRFSRLHDRNYISHKLDGNVNGNGGGGACSSDEERLSGIAVKRQRLRCTPQMGELAHGLDVDISSICTVADEYEHNEKVTPAIAEQVAASSSCDQKVFEDDTWIAPPSGNTTALPYLESSAPVFQRLTEPSGTCATKLTKAIPPRDYCVGELQRSGKCREELLCTSDEKGAKYVETTLSTTPNSSGNGTVLTDSPETTVRQMEETYKRIALRLLAEIQRLDAQTAAMSSQSEVERKNWLRAQCELKSQLVDRDVLIGTLKEHLQSVYQRESADSPRVSCTTELLLGGKEGVTRTPSTTVNEQCVSERRGVKIAGAHMHDHPGPSTEPCCVSPSPSQPMPQRPQNEKSGGRDKKPSTLESCRSFGADVDTTRSHPLIEFLQQRISSWGASCGLSDGSALQETVKAASHAEDVLKRGQLVRGGNSIAHLQAAAETPPLEKTKGLRESTEKFAMRKKRSFGKSCNLLAPNHKIRNTCADTVVSDLYGGHGSRVFVTGNECRETHHREHNRTHASFSRGREGRISRTRREACKKRSGCQLCCHDVAAQTARGVSVSPQCGVNSGGFSVTCRGRREAISASRGCRAVSLTRKRAKWNEKKNEKKAVLYELVLKSTLMEARLRSVQERLDKQEVGFQEVVRFIRDFVQFFTKDSQDILSGVSVS